MTQYLDKLAIIPNGGSLSKSRFFRGGKDDLQKRNSEKNNTIIMITLI